MSMAWIRNNYRVPAKRGGRIQYTGGWNDKTKSEFGTIRSARGGRLRIQMDGETHTSIFHPTWKLTYLSDVPT